MTFSENSVLTVAEFYHQFGLRGVSRLRLLVALSAKRSPSLFRGGRTTTAIKGT